MRKRSTAVVAKRYIYHLLQTLLKIGIWRKQGGWTLLKIVIRQKQGGWTLLKTSIWQKQGGWTLLKIVIEWK